MGEVLLEKNCISCKHFRSFYEEYDYDELEPRWCGRCLNESIIKKSTMEGCIDDYVDEDSICNLWEK